MRLCLINILTLQSVKIAGKIKTKELNIASSIRALKAHFYSRLHTYAYAVNYRKELLMTKPKNTKPSQTPWLLNNDVLENNKKRLALLTPYSRVMSESDSKQFEANAAYIVKAVNNFEPLLESLEHLIKFYRDTQGLDLPELETLIKKARDL